MNQLKTKSLPLLDDKQCGEVIRYAESLGVAPATVIGGRSLARTCATRWLEPCDQTDWLYGLMYEAVEEANKEFGFDISHIEDFQYLRYRPGGWYLRHFDSGHEDVATRKLTVIVQLSPSRSYLGGNLSILSQDGGSAPRGRGLATVFPSFLAHTARPVWLGTRRVLVTWARGKTPLR